MVSVTQILEPGYRCDSADLVFDADFRDLSPRLSAASMRSPSHAQEGCRETLLVWPCRGWTFTYAMIPK